MYSCNIHWSAVVDGICRDGLSRRVIGIYLACRRSAVFVTLLSFNTQGVTGSSQSITIDIVPLE